MSCDRTGRRCANAARRNGVSSQVSRFLSTLGNWSTYRDLASLEEIPDRLAQVAGAYLGLQGLGVDQKQTISLLGIILGVHALEKGTGMAGTAAVRLLAPGRPVGLWRGVIIRRSKITPRLARVLGKLTGGRLLAAEGYYFHEGGSTWHGQSFTLAVKGVPRTLTHIRSLSIPHREYFFDRPLTLAGPADDGTEPQVGEDGHRRSLSLQRLVDVVMGEAPETIPGYIGGTNELENMVAPLGGLKRLLFMANWFLVDESERDAPGGPEFVDYDALLRGSQPGSDYYQVRRSSSPAGPPTWPRASGSRPVRVPVRNTTSSPAPVSRPGSTASSNQPYGANLFGSSARPPTARQAQRATLHGQPRPVVIRRLIKSPLEPTAPARVDAAYWDEDLKRWREVVDEPTRTALAQAVQEGRLVVDPPENWPRTS